MNPRGIHLADAIRLIVPALLTAVLAGCGGAEADGSEGEVESAPGAGQLHPVHVLRPAQPRVLTGNRLPDGTAETIACSTCHATKRPNAALTSAAELDEFHQGLQFAHGTLSCLSCHDRDNYDQLRLADGRPVAFPDAMDLCAQCHGPQHRDYQHGSHGGMTGYWDRTRGSRTRNHCITCHDPHAPAYPKLMPVFKPLDAPPSHGSRKP